MNNINVEKFVDAYLHDSEFRDSIDFIVESTVHGEDCELVLGEVFTIPYTIILVLRNLTLMIRRLENYEEIVKGGN